MEQLDEVRASKAVKSFDLTMNTKHSITGPKALSKSFAMGE